MTLKDFITKAREIHGNKYDYSKVDYVNGSIKVCIIDPEYGEFWQKPNNHLKGCGCPKRSGKHVPTTEEWIAKARLVHGDKYDYSKVVYVDSNTKVCIIDPEYGEFLQTPANHLLGMGCPKREQIAIDKLKQAIVENFIKNARLVHGDKYDYSKVNYVNGKTKVCIIDPDYGEFWQKPNDHLKGCGCSKRDVEQNSEKQSLLTKAFIKRARLIHGDKYDYSKVVYVDSNTKVCIISPELGEFWQTPNDHLKGCGCSKRDVEQNSEKQSLLTKAFIKRARLIHGDKYDYSKVVYVDSNTKVCIISPELGEFWQTPIDHLLCGNHDECVYTEKVE